METPEHRSLGTGLPVEALEDAARALPVQDFERRYGRGFLLVTATRVDGLKGETTTHLLLDDDPAGRTADLAHCAYPLCPQTDSPGHLVTLGRESRHDVAIPDASVSRFHAFAKLSPEGGFLLQDAGSTNGTSVNGVSVPGRGAGPPTPLKPGDSVRIGQVDFTFTDAAGLRSFILGVLGD